MSDLFPFDDDFKLPKLVDDRDYKKPDKGHFEAFMSGVGVTLTIVASVATIVTTMFGALKKIHDS